MSGIADYAEVGGFLGQVYLPGKVRSGDIYGDRPGLSGAVGGIGKAVFQPGEKILGKKGA